MTAKEAVPLPWAYGDCRKHNGLTAWLDDIRHAVIQLTMDERANSEQDLHCLPMGHVRTIGFLRGIVSIR